MQDDTVDVRAQLDEIEGQLLKVRRLLDRVELVLQAETARAVQDRARTRATGEGWPLPEGLRR